jgi:hypothetical protein
MKDIRDKTGKVIGRIQDTGDVVNLYEVPSCRLKGRYIKSSDKTFDEHGHFFGFSDQLMRLLN